MTEQIEREKIVKEFWTLLIANKIIAIDRNQRINIHQDRFKEIHEQLINQLIYLNNVRHPGYMTFFWGRKRSRDFLDEEEE